MSSLSICKYLRLTQLDRDQTQKLRQFILFLVNGGLLGIVSWAGQLWIYGVLGGSTFDYTIATALVYPPLIVINFIIQRVLIFSKPGLFFRFVIANLGILLLVSFLSPMNRWIIGELLSPIWGDRLGFAVSALMGAVPSFFLKRWWVFGLK